MNEAVGLVGVFAAPGDLPAPYAGEVGRLEGIIVDNVADDTEDEGDLETVGGPAVVTGGLGEIGDED